jgi:hypothetical protein
MRFSVSPELAPPRCRAPPHQARAAPPRCQAPPHRARAAPPDVEHLLIELRRVSTRRARCHPPRRVRAAATHGLHHRGVRGNAVIEEVLTVYVINPLIFH